ncbi:MAG: hypothetical protein ACFN1I_09825, partial [Selenomonas artemidis]
MQVWKLLLAAKGLLWGVRKLRERKHFRRGIIAGAAIALAAPLAIHAPAEAAQILVKEGMRGGAVQHVQELLIKARCLWDKANLLTVSARIFSQLQTINPN